MNYDYLIAGCGFAGAVLAERLASKLGKRCLVVDKRDHIAGNAYDEEDAAGVLIHRYGPHYFRTNSQEVVDYLGAFTRWTPVDYKILSWTDGEFWPFPINLNTFEKFIGRASSSDEMRATLEKWRVPIDEPANSEEVIVSQVGRELYEKFFKNYTFKQWRRDPSELDASVCGRIPIRFNRDDRYLSERFQALPTRGYTAMFEKMLAHPGIDLVLGRDYREVATEVDCGHLIYTGPVDAYFGYCDGELPYRTLRFEPETLQQQFYQPAVQVNYPNDHDFTRIVEIKHITGQELPVTTIVREFPDDYARGKEPYYPVPCPASKAVYGRYAARAQVEQGVTFVGRLAKYRYYNMDQVVAMALKEFEKIASGQAIAF